MKKASLASLTALLAISLAGILASGCGDETVAPDQDIINDVNDIATTDVTPDIAVCVPDCTGKTCGWNGCDGDCGACDNNTVCDGTSCIANPCPADFVLIPAWTFTAGSPSDEPGREPGGTDETAHTVEITKAFCMSVTEVTQAEWVGLVGYSPSYFKSCGDNCPISQISWFDAIGYCNARSTNEGLTPCYTVSGEQGTFGGGCVEGQVQCSGNYGYESVTYVGPSCTGYRLPTEAEWELAARAGKAGATYVGNVTDDLLDCQTPNSVLDPIAWYCGNDEVTYTEGYDCAAWSTFDKCGPQPVKGKTANAWGLYDMLGNVFEFCWNYYDEYPATSVVDPMGPDTGYNRMARGGAWDSNARYVRAAARIGTWAGDRGDMGIRLVRMPATAGGVQ